MFHSVTPERKTNKSWTFPPFISAALAKVAAKYTRGFSEAVLSLSLSSRPITLLQHFLSCLARLDSSCAGNYFSFSMGENKSPLESPLWMKMLAKINSTYSVTRNCVNTQPSTPLRRGDFRDILVLNPSRGEGLANVGFWTTGKDFSRAIAMGFFRSLQPRLSRNSHGLLLIVQKISFPIS